MTHSSKPSSTRVGDEFEATILEILRSEIEAERFHFKSECAKVFQKKGYYSRDRNSDIVFDIAIELSMPGAESYSSLILVECKRLARPVSVDDLEEFFAKLQQVGGARDKGIIVSLGGFQRAALEYGRSKGFGLARYFPGDELKWELRRSPVASTWAGTDADEILRGLLVDEYEDANSAFYCVAPSAPVRTFNSLLQELTSGIADHAIVQQATAVETAVPYISKDQIESEVQDALSSIGYTGGQVSLQDLEHRTGLRVLRAVAPGATERARHILGRIVFGETSVVTLYDYPEHEQSRIRFTLAHEFGHYLLRHGRYISSEYCDALDHDYGPDPRITRVDIKRMEWQANYFASLLLMPTASVVRDLADLAQKHDLKDRGHGLIYVDNQPVNLGIFYRVTSDLKQRYNVSRAVVQHRLQGLGLLNDARDGGLRRLRDVL